MFSEFLLQLPTALLAALAVAMVLTVLMAKLNRNDQIFKLGKHLTGIKVCFFGWSLFRQSQKKYVTSMSQRYHGGVGDIEICEDEQDSRTVDDAVKTI
jgi:ABC-type uncharacterized transport system permease subunit